MLTVSSVLFFLLFWLSWLLGPIVSYCVWRRDGRRGWKGNDDDRCLLAAIPGAGTFVCTILLVSTLFACLYISNYSPLPKKAVVTQEVGDSIYWVQYELWRPEPWHSVKLVKDYEPTYKPFYSCVEAQTYADALNTNQTLRVVDCAQEAK